MPRIRYLKPEFFSDEDLAELPFQARLTFAGLWCYADKSGRLEERPKYLKAMIFPYDNIDILKMLDLLSSGKPFIHRYETDGKHYIQIQNWNKHQKPHHTEADSKIPPAPPLREDKGNGDGKAARSELELSNGDKTVKEPLKNVSILKPIDFYGEFNNVKLKKNDYNKLILKFGENGTKERIENLSQAIASKGYRYKDHYATILTWDRKNPKPLQTTIKESPPPEIIPKDFVPDPYGKERLEEIIGSLSTKKSISPSHNEQERRKQLEQQKKELGV